MIYSGENLNEISFPIGGIGTGSFGIAGNGRFVDFEIFNRPSKGSVQGFTHIAVTAKTEGQRVVKILNGDYTKDLTGTYDRGAFHGFGFGPRTETMAALPHFGNVTFKGEFPIAELTFADADFPGKVVLTAFNPFIPLDADNSSIPAGFFNIKFINDTENEVEYGAYFTVSSPFEQSVNELVDKDGIKMAKLGTNVESTDFMYGDMCIATDSPNTYVQQYWYRGAWQDGLDVFVKEIYLDAPIKNRVYSEAGKKDTATIQSIVTADSGMCADVRFVLSWYIPNNRNYWDTKRDEYEPWKNYYATVYESSVDCAEYCIEKYDSLLSRTLSFKNALFDTTVDPVIIDAVSSTMSVLKTATVLRLEDGSFYGWEGMHELEGSCAGTCQHVWNYAYALCFLFPELERSIRNNEFSEATMDNGRTAFRMVIPKGHQDYSFRPCLDGQMGMVIKTYREWKISGDNEWLKLVWDKVKLVLNYAWSPENEDKWDADHDGVLEGRQHHTLDMELFGASSWLEGMYLCALKAACEMARFLGDAEAEGEYTELFENGKKWTRENLFNGEYFIQKTDLSDKSYTEKFDCENYWYDEAGELKYQIATGCEIDQVLGQWHSDLLGLGEIFDKKQLDTALASIYKYNFKSMRDVLNTWRIFALNDEKGAIMCSFPEKKPTIPLSYHTEVMTGFEYSLAGLMIAEGMEKEGIEIVKAVRDRYDGKKRNPWNEIECGSNYARAMASFALLPIYSGFKFDLPNKMIGFAPIHREGFKSIFSVGEGWGTVAFGDDRITVKLFEGGLTLNKFAVEANVKGVIIDGSAVEFTYNDGVINFADIKINDSLVVMI